MSLPNLIAIATAAALPAVTLFSDATPPARFQGDAKVLVEFTHQTGINKNCQALFGTPPPGHKTDACFTGDRIIMPNPCTFPASDTYAHMMCHELGHVNGWPNTHGG